MYADNMTDSMKLAISETNRRRAIQEAFNQEHGIEPRGIIKGVRDLTERVKVMAESKSEYQTGGRGSKGDKHEEPAHATVDVTMLGTEELARLVAQVEKEMKDAAKALQFEKAALLRDQLVELRRTQVEKKVAV